MESIIATLIVITLVLTGGLMMAQRYLASQETVMLAWLSMERRSEQRVRTQMTTVTTETDGSGEVVELVLANTGETKLADFDQWDVIVQYQSVEGYSVDWLPYVEGAPGLDEWSVVGIYLDAATATAEVNDPGIVNSDEEVLLRVRLSPAIEVGSTNLARIVTPNGVGVSATFTR